MRCSSPAFPMQHCDFGILTVHAFGNLNRARSDKTSLARVHSQTTLMFFGLSDDGALFAQTRYLAVADSCSLAAPHLD